jgi:hypothetical protein
VPSDSLFVAYELGRTLKNYTKQKASTLEREFYVFVIQAINLLTTQEKHLKQLAGISKQEKILNRYSNVLPCIH